MERTTTVYNPPPSQSLVPEYSNPTADVKLVSEDGKKFKVHSYYLKAHSSFFRDMLSSTQLGTLCEDYLDNHPSQVSRCSEIHLELSAPDLSVLLRLIIEGDQRHPVDIVQWGRLALFAHKFGCDPLYHRVIRDLNEKASANPWEVFCLASHLDEVKLAQRAVGVMHQDRTLHPTVIAAPRDGSHYQYVSPLHKITRAYFDKCSRNYYWAWTKAIAEYEENGVGGRFNQYHWFQVAELLPKYLVGGRSGPSIIA
ncbi:hypothetical protein DB88DRAFT_153004 [Papiliotrema laurentii]|uniref:BTB domain-containing protein n=1 Tax=Papiliotrema laurentii TaxID=5418 RepID=A0AAD9FU68_PAPLA|nr:hypothetical protein DB88DRAFT_153004 [Papiliotrema laurentii]